MKDLIKKLIKEEIFRKKSKDQVELLNKFLDFACEFLKVKKPRVELKFNRDDLVTTASYGNKKVKVYAKDRALVDIMRSIAHELVHLKQDKDGRLDDKDYKKNNDAGSPIENEANAKAGEIIRNFGQKHPEIYE
jgi:Zn-dependent peptidase ImmA (M78 family)